jgi:hypothetical protein
MHNTNKNFQTNRWLWLWPTATGALAFAALLVGLAMGQARLSSAQDAAHETFASAEEASHALFAAVQSNNEQAIMQILGRDKELVSSGDELEDKRDRERFAQKYQEMHRLVREPDGTTVLYIGAENWPFPVPLVARRGQWFFDSDAGAQEILFRYIGENESIAIETSHALVLGSGNKQNETKTDSAITEYTRGLVSTRSANDGEAPANVDDMSGPFHGYYFRKLRGPDRRSHRSNSTAGGTAYIAYPAEYRSSGVMTFIVTPENAVYEKDLGPSTARIAKAMTAWKPDSTWHVAD